MMRILLVLAVAMSLPAFAQTNPLKPLGSRELVAESGRPGGMSLDCDQRTDGINFATRVMDRPRAAIDFAREGDPYRRCIEASDAVSGEMVFTSMNPKVQRGYVPSDAPHWAKKFNVSDRQVLTQIWRQECETPSGERVWQVEYIRYFYSRSTDSYVNKITYDYCGNEFYGYVTNKLRFTLPRVMDKQEVVKVVREYVGEILVYEKRRPCAPPPVIPSREVVTHTPEPARRLNFRVDEIPPMGPLPEVQQYQEVRTPMRNYVWRQPARPLVVFPANTYQVELGSLDVVIQSGGQTAKAKDDNQCDPLNPGTDPTLPPPPTPPGTDPTLPPVDPGTPPNNTEHWHYDPLTGNWTWIPRPDSATGTPNANDLPATLPRRK